MSPPLLIRRARVLTMGNGPGPRRGIAMGDLGILDEADVLIEAGLVTELGPAIAPPRDATVIDAAGRVAMPGFVDCHTHTCWAGSRLDEWERARRGESYLEILASGGGIMATVRAVRDASEDDLADALHARLDRMLAHGTTTAEVKSGYGLSCAHEIKMLRAIAQAGERWTGTVVPTACIGHAIDPEESDFVARTIDQTLPRIHQAFPGVTIDAYCEQGAWSFDQTVELFEAATQLGHRFRVHADQFTSLGMTPWAARHEAISVDHLEASTSHDLRALAGSGSFGVVLPCSGFHVDGRYADGRALLDAGGALAVATNCNPGSAPCSAIPMAIALAVRGNGLSAHEAILGCTRNAASLLGLDDRGRIEPGRRADLILLGTHDERALGHEFGANPVDVVICGGAIVHDRCSR